MPAMILIDNNLKQRKMKKFLAIMAAAVCSLALISAAVPENDNHSESPVTVTWQGRTYNTDFGVVSTIYGLMPQNLKSEVSSAWTQFVRPYVSGSGVKSGTYEDVKYKVDPAARTIEMSCYGVTVKVSNIGVQDIDKVLGTGK